MRHAGSASSSSAALIAYRGLFNWIRPGDVHPDDAREPALPADLLHQARPVRARASQRDFYIVGNSVQVCAMSSVYGMTMAVANERWFGTLGPLLASPANRAAVFLGRGVPVLANGLVRLGLHVRRRRAASSASARASTRCPRSPRSSSSRSRRAPASGCCSARSGCGRRTSSSPPTSPYFLMLLFCGVNIPLDVLPGWMSVDRALPAADARDRRGPRGRGGREPRPTSPGSSGRSRDRGRLRRGRLRALPLPRARVPPQRRARRLLETQKRRPRHPKRGAAAHRVGRRVHRERTRPGNGPSGPLRPRLGGQCGALSSPCCRRQSSPVSPRSALAGGGSYAFAGGTPKEQATVHSALEASSFDWGLIPRTIAIHIGAVSATPTPTSARSTWTPRCSIRAASPGASSSTRSAHQVDFFLFDDAQARAAAAAARRQGLVLRHPGPGALGLRLRAVRLGARVGVLASRRTTR